MTQRELHTAQEIRDEISRLLNAGRRVAITVPLPTRLSMRSDPFTDHEASWQVPEHRSFAIDREAVRIAILAVKAKWDLRQ